MNATFAIEEMRRSDWSRVRAIYGEGLATGLAAFILAPPIWKNWNAGHLPFGRFVARGNNGTLLGWSALTPVENA